MKAGAKAKKINEQICIPVGCLPIGGGLLTYREGLPAPWYCAKADLPLNRMRDASENITLPHTSYADGNKRRTAHKVFAFAPLSLDVNGSLEVLTQLHCNADSTLYY